MKTYSSLWCATLILGALAFTNTANSQPTTTLRDVVVTASRVQQPLSDVVADVSIIDRDQIQRLGANSAPQLLARLPGVQAVSFGDKARVYIRGADSRMTALYVDGVRIDSQDGLSLGGGVPWDLVPTSEIERIEVLRGPASAVYGSDAMGGVIQIFTRRGETGWHPYADVGVGSSNLRKLGAGVSGAQGGWDYALGIGYEDQKGYDTRPDLVHMPSREPSTRSSANVRVGYQVALIHRLDLVATDSELKSQYVPWGGGSNIKAVGNLSTSALKWSAKWTDSYSSRLSLTRSKVAKRDDVPYDYETTLKGILLENNFRWAGGTLTANVEHKRDEFDSKLSGWDPAFGGQRTQNAVALGYGTRLGAHTFQLNLRNDRDSVFGSHQTGAAAYAYAFTPNWRATLSSGTAFRAPTLEQLFGPYGSSTLRPESNINSEVGLRYEDQMQSFKAVAFRNVIADMISSSASLTTCSAGFFCYYNVGRASIQGITVSGTRQFGRIDLRASMDFLDPIDQSTGRVLSLRSRKSMILGADMRLGLWQLGAEAQAVGERFDNAANTIVLPGYVLFNLSASKQLSRDWRLVMRMDNAADTSYQQIGQYATPGRIFYTGLQWSPL